MVAAGTPDGEFWRNLRILFDVKHGKRWKCPETEEALSYFGFKFVLDGIHADDGMHSEFTNYGHIETDYDGMGARPEWAQTDRNRLGHFIINVENALRSMIEQIKAINYEEDTLMTGIERQHLNAVRPFKDIVVWRW